jgi:hypothetical protein
LTDTPAHWHHAISQSLNDEGTAFRTACGTENWPTDAEARRQLVAPILAMPETFGSLTKVAQAFIRQPEPYLYVPSVVILAVYPCNGDCGASERAHLDRVMDRPAAPSAPLDWMIQPSCN